MKKVEALLKTFADDFVDSVIEEVKERIAANPEIGKSKEAILKEVIRVLREVENRQKTGKTK